MYELPEADVLTNELPKPCLVDDDHFEVDHIPAFSKTKLNYYGSPLL